LTKLVKFFFYLALSNKIRYTKSFWWIRFISWR